MDIKEEELDRLVRTFCVLDRDDGRKENEDSYTSGDEGRRFETDEDAETDDSEDGDRPKCEKCIGSLSDVKQSEGVNVRNDAGAISDIDKEVLPVRPGDPDAYYNSFAEQYKTFTDKNPSTYHVVAHFRSLLENNGFRYISESKKIGTELQEDIAQNGGLYYTVRSDLSLVAFVIGGKWEAEKGVGVIGTHVDALTAKLKPNSRLPNKEGYQLLGVANYGGTLNHLWLDRDLGIAGSILVEENGIVRRKLVSSSPYPIARIPSLAPHFGRVATKTYNKETEMVPIVGYGSAVSEESTTEEERHSPLFGKHSIELLRYISKLADTPVSQILELDLELFDVHKASSGGLNNEFIFAPRIDDRLCTFSAIYALIEFSQRFYADPSGDANHPFKEYDGFNIVSLNDNEEIGSQTRTGAKGKLLISTIQRLATVKSSNDLGLTFANSIILSADVTHSLNPNFKNQYLDGHFPLPNVGLTIKADANQHVVTDSVGKALLKKIARESGQKLQDFHIRNDSRSGGTIGPILASETGARVIDVGLPQLSMHSIRGTCGTKDPGLGVKIFEEFFSRWRKAYDSFEY